jgi:hypothetical protein
MKPKTFILLSALSVLQLQTHGQSGEFSDAISDLKTKNEEALQKLKDTQGTLRILSALHPRQRLIGIE